MQPITGYPHIERDAKGTLYVTGSRYKVLPLIVDHIEWKMDAVQIVAQHRELSLGAAHSVLAYFYDHETELREEIDRRHREAEATLARVGTKLDKRALLARLQADVAAEAATRALHLH